MELTLIRKDAIYFCILPKKQSGQYWITHMNKNGDEERVISVEGVEGEWILKSNKNAWIQDENNERVKESVVKPLCFYNIRLKNYNERALLYSEPTTEDRKYFNKLLFPTQGKLIIGRDEECDISFSNNLVSSKHAEINISTNEITVKDLNSSNGTFVNGQRIKTKSLKPGDMIYIMGLKIVISKGFIAVNNPDGQVFYNKSVLSPFIKQSVEFLDEEENIDDEVISSNSFYRSPRFKKDIKKAEIKVDPPPTRGNLEQIPLTLLLGPAITMGLTSLFTGLLTLQNVLRTGGNIMTAMPTLMMSFSMLLGTILWPVLTKRYEKRNSIKRENERQKKYKEYIAKIREEISQECIHQSEILNENYVTIENCVSRIKLRERNLWERTMDHNDFLRVRVGIGDLPLEAEIKYPEKKFTMDEDSLLEELYQLAEEPKMLHEVPITLSLREKNVGGIIGNRKNVTSLVKGLIVQLTALHSYDELKLVFIYDKKEQDIWNFVKWLPHVWNEEKSIRFIATNSSEIKELSAFIEKELTKREGISAEEELKNINPYYVIFAMDKELAGKAEMINSVLRHKKNYGFSLITLYDELKNLPKECSTVIEIESTTSKIYDKNDITGSYLAFQPDIYLEENPEKLAIALSNIQLDTSLQAYKLPNMLTFLEMFDVGKIEHLNALTRWKENNPTITLEAPIGIDRTGQIFKLDLHEKFHGPHGLIAGMTGSGKSEFIMSFILSLALNYHPYEIAFILIDYKGGGMANTFSNLPHLAGTITNLDGAAVNRSLISIQSELKRRQAIFNETSKKVNVSNIDIYKYQKLYRDGVVDEPLQHLFIISDEFAELKTQQPEFMEQLVSAARIGRSLGVHLILATQKPSGVVDDQIWSNSKFRICLKVQEKADSMDVIKKPDAAELSVTGRFFVQVGFNEVFELGQSAWSGAPYYPVDRIQKSVEDDVTIIDNLGRVIKQVKLDKRKNNLKNPPKQIDEIVKYLEELATEENIKVRPLWMEPIPELIYLDELKKKYKNNKINNYLNPIIGEMDDPTNQRQVKMTLPITEEGNVVIYGSAGSGKTTFLNTLIYSLIENHTPLELSLYIVDFGSETLRAFDKAPHVGDVLLSQDSEKINNLFKFLNKEIEKRKKMFSDFGGDYISYIKSAQKEMELIVVIIHNFSAFTETYEEKEEAIAYLTREGIKYGIYFIVTALNTGAIRYRILQNFKQLYVLQLNDQSDYSAVLGNVNGVYPSKYKGRGIVKIDKIYEFQIAHISKQAENSLEFIRNYCSEYANRWDKAPARKIPILPKKIDVDYFSSEIKHSTHNKIPVGVEKNSLNTAYYDFCKTYINLILSQKDSRVEFIQGLAEVIAAKEASKVIVIDPESMLMTDGSRKYQYIETDFDEAVADLFNMVVYRNNTFKDAKEQGKDLPTFDRSIFIINSISSLMSRISEDSKDKLRLSLEKGNIAYNVIFIINDNVTNISSITYEGWFKAQVSLSDGIWVGNGIADQYQFGINKITNDLYQDIGDDFGYLINKGKVTLIKLLSTITSDEEDELHG